MRSSKFHRLMLRFISLIFLFILARCANKTETTSPAIRSITESIYASGRIVSRDQYEVRPVVSGTISEILVNEGMIIKKDQSLFIIQNESSKLGMINSKLAADYSETRANRTKLEEAIASIELTKTRMINDSLLVTRQRTLWSQRIGTLVELEQRELAFRNSTTNYQVAKLNYIELKRQIDFTAQQATNNFKISTSLARDYVVRSIANGKVYKIFPKKGEFVNALNAVALIGDAKQFLIELKVDEYDIAKVRNGQKVISTMNSYKGEVFEAQIEKIEPFMNEESRSFLVEAIFASRPETLYPNLTVEANIIIRQKIKALVIPRSYLLGDSLVIMSDGKRRKVKVGIKDYQLVEILDGLTTEDVIQKQLP